MRPAVIPQTVKSSELSRNSAAVFKAVDQGQVTITRRDGETLILTKESDLARQRQGLELAAHLVAASLASDDVPFVDRLRRPFPWVEFLSPTDRETFAQAPSGRPVSNHSDSCSTHGAYWTHGWRHDFSKRRASARPAHRAAAGRSRSAGSGTALLGDWTG